jgi:SAM-dependent methyltransferase
VNSSVTDERIEELSETITDEVFKAVGLSPRGLVRKLLGGAMRKPAHRFAELAAGFDAHLAEHGLRSASQTYLPYFVKDMQVRGAEHIPEQGPVVIVSNHPGTYDGLVIMANVPREDIRLVAGSVPFLHVLPAIKEHLIYVTPDAHVRMLAVRELLRHLEEGGTLLLFASRRIDPDPDVLPGAAERIRAWSPSLDIILRRVPETRVVMTIVSGVLAAACANHPLTRLKEDLTDRLRIAEMLQIIQQMAFRKEYALQPRVSFAKPIAAVDLGKYRGRRDYTQEIIKRALVLLEEHMLLG